MAAAAAAAAKAKAAAAPPQAAPKSKAAGPPPGSQPGSSQDGVPGGPPRNVIEQMGSTHREVKKVDVGVVEVDKLVRRVAQLLDGVDAKIVKMHNEIC
jgi:hypothetical protein